MVAKNKKNVGPGHARPPLVRMLKIHQALQAGGYPNCRRLAEELEVAGKTIQRDIDFMRDQLGLPIEYDSGRFPRRNYFPSMWHKKRWQSTAALHWSDRWRMPWGG